jgi:hypothetical protein
MIVLARLGPSLNASGHSRPHGPAGYQWSFQVVPSAGLVPINASGFKLLGRQPAKSGSSLSQRSQGGSKFELLGLKASFLCLLLVEASKALSALAR